MFPPIGWPFSYRVLPVLTRARLAPRVHRGEAMLRLPGFRRQRIGPYFCRHSVV